MTTEQIAGLMLYELQSIEANLTGKDYAPARIADSLNRAKRAIELAKQTEVKPLTIGDVLYA